MWQYEKYKPHAQEISGVDKNDRAKDKQCQS